MISLQDLTSSLSEPRPSLDKHGFIAHTEEIVIEVPLKRFDEWSWSTSLDSVLKGTKRISRVVRTEIIEGTWGEVGARRRVIMEDGNEAVEEILENVRPTLFRYQVWGFTNRGRILTNYAIGEFRYSEDSGKTKVKWTYSFHRRFLLAAPFLSRFVKTDFSEFMRNALQTIKQKAEQHHSEQQ